MTKPREKPRILLVTRNLPPLTGGMERLMQEMALGISDYAELTIVGPRGCSAYCPANVTVYETSAKLAPFLLLSVWKAANACRKSNFTLIIGGSGLIAPALILLRSLFDVKTLVFLHGLDLVVDSFIYQKLFIPCIRGVDHVIANSNNTLQIATKKGVKKSCITIINPGTHLPDHTQIESREEFLSHSGIPFQKVMLFVGRITKRKGLYRFIQHSLPTILASEPEAGLIVVGENPNQSLTKHGEGKEVTDLVSSLMLGNQVIFLGQLNDKDLETCYAAADVQIFPLIEIRGDVEGFGMVAIEAAACGTPTVAFSVGGVTDAVSAQNGELVEPGRYDLLTDAVLRILRDGMPDKHQCTEHARRFDWDIYNKKIRGVVGLLE